MSLDRGRGFTLIELLVTVTILGILASIAFPLSEVWARRSKEAELRTALRQLRSAIDAYKRASDEGHISKAANESGYPPSLKALVEGVRDAKSPKEARIYFLRRLPRDPMADPQIPAEQTWFTRSYESPPEQPRQGKDVFDVFSRSERVGLNAVPYSQW